MELYQANEQWQNRPPDECYPSLKALGAACDQRRTDGKTHRIRTSQMAFHRNEDLNALTMVGSNVELVPTHWAFGQVCEFLKADSAWLRKVGSGAGADLNLVAANLNWAARNSEREDLAMLWQHTKDPAVMRAVTSLGYARLWDADVVTWLRQMTQDESNGWQRPPSIKDDEAPRGIYGGDRNIFVFLTNESVAIDDGKKGMYRGFFCWNSEVRQMSFGFNAFLYEKVCGNHIVWGAKELFNLRMVHVGEKLTERVKRELMMVISKYINSSAEGDQAVINAARAYTVGKNAAEAVAWLTEARRGKGAWKPAQAVEIVKAAEVAGDDPTILWNLVFHITQLNQRIKHADERTARDRAAGELLNAVL